MTLSPIDFPTDLLRHSDLIGKLVLDRVSTEEVGHVDQLWLDPKAHQMIGFTCRSGLLGFEKQSFSWTQIESIGADGILVSVLQGAESDRPANTEQIVGHELWTDDGNQAGTITDYRFHAETGDILDYLFISNGWRGLTEGMYRLLPNSIVSTGSRRMIASNQAIQNAQHYAGGISWTVAQAKEFLKSDYARTQQDLNAAVEGTKAIAQQLQATTRQVAEQAKAKLSNVAGQLQDKPQARLPGTTESLEPLEPLDSLESLPEQARMKDEG
jgi:uncharacterized protein YrrD